MVADATSEPFAPISPNPYIVGNPVRDRSMFFGREAEFELVRKRFQHSATGGLLVFCGERRSGKTSILFQILDGRLGPDFVPVLIDMQSMAIDSEADFLGKLSGEVKDALGESGRDVQLPDFRPGTNHAATFRAFIERVLEVHPDRKLILLFDEYELFENKIDSGLLSEDILHTLSSLMENHSVFLIFTGSQQLEARRQDYWRILGKSIYRTISYLQRDDALRLIRQPVAGLVQYDDDAVAHIHRLTAGQPFYTQAVCQSLVDLLNERHERHATTALIEEVVTGLVENPLPQMIFLWDTLERDEKLVLALLSEALGDESSSAPAPVLSKMLRQRQYPVELSRARLATMLEKLFRSEFLLKDDRAHPPVYCFRMDLWRRWIRRGHSVWQVVREEGLSLRPTNLARSRRLRLGLAAAVIVAVAVVGTLTGRDLLRRERAATEHPAGPAGTAAANFELSVVPEGAAVYVGDRLAGTGRLRERLEPGTAHRLRVTAPGYAETTFTIRLAPGTREARALRLRPFLGGVRVETVPPGALVTIDGRPAGRSPLTVDGLPVATAHQVEAVLAGHRSARQRVTLETGRTTAVSLPLAPGQAAVIVTSDPPGAQVLVDGVPRGSTPLTLTSLTMGVHRLEARSESSAPRETTLEITPATTQVHLALQPIPPGVLVIQGDRPAQIYVDDALIVENVQNSGPRDLRPGPHQVRVVMISGDMVEQTISVRSGECAVFDYSRNSVERRPCGARGS
jgi:hypothetical protein